MKKFIPPKQKQEEAILQDKLVKMLRIREWNILETHGNKYQAGFPDLYCFHHIYGERWVEVKLPDAISFTEYQAYYFPIIKNVWVLTDTTSFEYRKLWQNPNYNYLLGYHKDPKKKETIVQKHREGQIQLQVQADLEALGYTVMCTYGNNIQKGLPDLYLIKGNRRQWLELKRIDSFTPAQIKNFPRMQACGVKIWVLDVSKDTYDLSILKDEPNLVCHR